MSSLEHKLRVVGVLVAHDVRRDPGIQIEGSKPILEHLVVVDNAPMGHPDLRNLKTDGRLFIVKNFNIGGLAGAYNAAIDLIRTQLREVTHVIFIDDDSELASLEEFLRGQSTVSLALDPTVAVVAPVYVDRQTGLRGAHIKLLRFRFKVIPRDISVPTDVSFLINSMSLWKLSALTDIGAHDVTLGVDHVDTDYCLRAAGAGYRLVLDPSVSFLHSIGDRRRYKLLGLTFQAGGHSAGRRRMIARNTVVLAKRYWLWQPAFAVLCWMRLWYEILGITMAETDRLKKLRAVIRGTFEGLVA